MKKAGSILLSIIMALSLVMGVFPVTVIAADEGEAFFEDIDVTPKKISFGTYSVNGGKYQEARIYMTITNNKTRKLSVDISRKSQMSHFNVSGSITSGAVVLDSGESVSLTISPKNGLTVGSYSESLVLEYFSGSTTANAKYPITMTLEDRSGADPTIVNADPISFELTEGYDAAESAVVMSLSNDTSIDAVISDYSISAEGFSVVPVSGDGKSIPAKGTAQFKIIPKAGMKADNATHTGKLTFTFTETDGSKTIMNVDINWKVTSAPVPVVSVSPTVIDFGTLTEGYTVPEAKTVTVTNSVEGSIVNVLRPEAKYFTVGQLVRDGKSYYEKASVIGGTPLTFTVAPAAGKTAGTYEETLTVKLTDESEKDFGTKTVTAKYKVVKKDNEKYNVSLISDGNGGVSVLDPSLGEKNTMKISAEPSEGYVFKEWQIVSGKGEIAAPKSAVTTIKSVQEDIELKAVFKKIPEGQHFVKVTVSGGGSAWAEPTTGVENDKIDIYAIADSGYHFVKYEFLINGETKQEFNDYTDIDFQLPDADIEVTAIFAPDPYTVTFTTEGGEGSVWSDRTTGKEKTTVEIAAICEEGYKFKEWKVVSGSVSIEDPTNPDTRFIFGKSDAVIKAVFAPMEYKVNVKVEGKGTVKVDETYGTGAFILDAVPDEGYEFKEWEISSANGPLHSTDKTLLLKCTIENVDVKAVFVASTALTTVTSTNKTTDTTTSVSTTVTTVSSEKNTTDSAKTTNSSKTTDTSKTSDSTSKTKATTTSTTAKTTASTAKSTASTTQTSTEPIVIDPNDILYGDVDLDGMIDLVDVTKLAKFLLSNTSYPLGNGDEVSYAKAKLACDVNGDGRIGVLDLSKLIEYNLGTFSADELKPNK